MCPFPPFASFLNAQITSLDNSFCFQIFQSWVQCIALYLTQIMGIPGLRTVVSKNRDKICTQFLCHKGNQMNTVEVVEKQKQQKHNPHNDDDEDDDKDDNKDNNDSEHFELVQTRFENKRQWIIFDGFSLVPVFFSMNKEAFMDFYKSKMKLKRWMDCWIQCMRFFFFVFYAFSLSWNSDVI